MAKRREKERLTAVTADNVAKAIPGKYCDGGGLWLIVRKSGSKSWVFRFMLNGKAVTMGLGSVDDVSFARAKASLAGARDKAHEYRKLLEDGKDPRDSRVARLAKPASFTFRQDAEKYLGNHEAGWVPDYLFASRRRLEIHVYPIVMDDGRRFGNLPVGEIDTSEVLTVLQPIWGKTNPTAQFVRILLEAILDFSKFLKHRTGENPALWRGNLKHALPRPGQVHKRKHRSALHYSKMPAYFRNLLGHEMTTPRSALEFDIYAPVRIDVAVRAEWEEFKPRETPDGVKFADRWTIPEEKMKGYMNIEYPDGKYEVPLIKPMINVLERMWYLRENNYVFSGKYFGSHVTKDAVLRSAKQLTTEEITTHGFRSSFSSWSDGCAFVHDWVMEMCLGHSLGTDTDKAYRRSDLFEKRRLLMEAWGEYLISGKAVPVDIKARFMERFKDQPLLLLADAAE